MRKVATVLVFGAMAAGPSAASGDDPAAAPQAHPIQVCAERCRLRRQYRKLRRATPREPIPTYITSCESHGYLRAHNPSGAGGRYQIMPSTWASALPSKTFQRIAEQLTKEQGKRRLRRHHRLDRGPRWSGRLLQDKVAETIYHRDGPGAWSCS